jgi:hypothetical protein
MDRVTLPTEVPGDVEAAARRAARAAWPVRVAKLGDQVADEPVGSPEDCLGAMWELVIQAWTLAGKPIPEYDRANMPIRKFRRGEEPAE